jgi:hypothetical protein
VLAERKRRDESLCHWAGRYHILFYAAASEALYGGKNCGQFVRKLSEKPHEYLRIYQRAIPGGLSAFQLTAKSCREFGYPEERSAMPGASATDEAYGTQYFCVFDGPATNTRRRVENKEIEPIIGEKLPENVAYIVTDELGHLAVFRIYQPTCSDANAVKYIRDRLTDFMTERALSECIKGRQFGFALLGVTPERVASLTRAIDRANLRNECEILVGLGPDAANLAKALKRRRAK